jgi:hypothetical protein
MSCQKGAYDLRFRPPHQTTYNLRWEIAGQVYFTLMGRKINTSVNNDVRSEISFDTLANAESKVSFSYRNLSMGQQVQGKQLRLDADAEKDSLVRASLAQLANIRFEARANAQGKLTPLTSGDSVWNKMENALAQLTGDDRVRVMTPLKSLLNDDMLVGLMEQCFYIFPDHKVDVGDTWKNQIKMRSVFSMNLNNSFELASVKDGVSEIKLTSKVINADNKGAMPGLALAASPILGDPAVTRGINLLGMNMEARFEGSHEGNLFVDVATGLLRNAHIHQKLKGEVKFNNMEFPMELDLHNKYSLEKKQ